MGAGISLEIGMDDPEVLRREEALQKSRLYEPIVAKDPCSPEHKERSLTQLANRIQAREFLLVYSLQRSMLD
jgi:hypothetical protein